MLNLFYYPSLNQWASFTGGVLVAGANIAWLVLLWRLKKQQDRTYRAITSPAQAETIALLSNCFGSYAALAHDSQLIFDSANIGTRNLPRHMARCICLA